MLNRLLSGSRPCPVAFAVPHRWRCQQAPRQLLAGRSFAGTTRPAPGLVLVDGKQSVELVKVELSRLLAANAQGVDVLTAGRQGVTVALRAAAALGDEGGSGRRPRTFYLRKAGHEELQKEGLEPPPHASRHSSRSTAGAADAEEAENDGRQGFRFSFLPRETPEAAPDGAPVSKVLRVRGGTGQFLPLTKAVATEVARCPEGSVAAVETALRGKSKNLWTRMHRLAQAVAQAYEWQVSPKSPRATTRRFRCAAHELLQKEDVLRDPMSREEGHEATSEDLLGTSGEIRVLRLTLVPEEPPQPRLQHRSESP